MKIPEKDRTLPGIVHDLNNVFQTLLGLSDVLGEDPQWATLSQALIRSIRRGQDLTTAIASDADHSAPLSSVVDGAVAFLQDSDWSVNGTGRKRQRIAFRCEIEPGISVRLGHAWERVFINLFLNAKRAMPKGGTILVRAKRNKSGIKIVVRDEGAGIAAELLDTLFEPRVSGHGSSGLGLYVVSTIVQRDGGTILARNRKKAPGAEFVIRLPAAGLPKSKAAKA